MSLKKSGSFLNSLTFRLTLWYAGIFAASSFVAFFLFYSLITSVIQEKTDQELLNQAGQFSAVLRERGTGAVENLALFEAQAAGEKKVFFRLLYPTGQAFSSSNMAYWKDIVIRKEAIGQLLGGAGPVIETAILTTRKDRVRILYAMIGPGVILQVGQSMENYTRIISAFRGIFLVTMALLIGLAAKNAILIVEFAKVEYEKGKGFAEAALEGARLRLRPILMTSFAFILGWTTISLRKLAAPKTSSIAHRT